MKLKFSIIALLFSTVSFAQNKEPGSWHIINAQLGLDKRWEAFAELQTRSNRFVRDFFYYEIKGGISYKVNKTFSLLVGTGRYVTYTGKGNFAGPPENSEFRVWQQVTINQHLERLKIEHRYRLEQRWRSDGYRNRFRYRLSAMVPLNKEKMAPGAIFVNIYDEIFLNNEPPHFERNRFFAGTGYIFTPVVTFQAGYVHQYNYTLDKRDRKDFVQLALFLKFGQADRREQAPSSAD